MAFITRFSRACCIWPPSMFAWSPSGASAWMVTDFSAA